MRQEPAKKSQSPFSIFNGHGNDADPDDETRHARFPHPRIKYGAGSNLPPPAGNPHPIPGGTTSHSTKLANNASQVAGYPPEGEGSFALSPFGGKMDRGLVANERLREFHVKEESVAKGLWKKCLERTNRYAGFTLMLLIFTLCLSWGTPASAQEQLKHNESRGELLYSMNCNSCHTSEVHWRKQKLAADWNSLIAQVRRWQANIGLVWSEEEMTDVAHYLNATYYDFPAIEQKGLLQDKKPLQVLRQYFN